MSALDVPLSLHLPKKTAKALEGAGVATVGDLLLVATTTGAASRRCPPCAKVRT